jgi:hypothetical protein
MIQETPTTLIKRIGGVAIVVWVDNSRFVAIVVADLGGLEEHKKVIYPAKPNSNYRLLFL